MSTRADPRPLIGEPLPLDLLNTRWSDDDGEHDLLADPDGTAIWLASNGLGEPEVPGTREALLATRTALLAADTDRNPLNEVLGHGRLRRELTGDGPRTVIETDTPAWHAAWQAADGYLRLLDDRPERIRTCAGPTCSLRFYDVSKAGARRWCSMAACGNRNKARDHYARQRRG